MLLDFLTQKLKFYSKLQVNLENRNFHIYRKVYDVIKSKFVSIKNLTTLLNSALKVVIENIFKDTISQYYIWNRHMTRVMTSQFFLKILFWNPVFLNQHHCLNKNLWIKTENSIRKFRSRDHPPGTSKSSFMVHLPKRNFAIFRPRA